MHAVLETGGKQYRVCVGEVVRVEKCSATKGDKIELGPILLLQKEEEVISDVERLKSAKVVCQVLQQGREKKIQIFKKKRRKNYRRSQGHRQSFTQLKVLEIVA
ncbi:MAG: 50S ribosomal protein L21 [Nitrospirae bacterium]|nr:50S ribosomal protein L21 [Candidatus Troglogloeales bacterium]MBI3597925.1 50S ribosomal protein L21 [Candidatus Troglogloeales bacterium]